jgi:hypothetical protein
MCIRSAREQGCAQAANEVVITVPIVWITARDGSIHATRPPIIADGQLMLCGHSYDRLDLRIRTQSSAGHAPAGACSACGERVADAVGETASPVQTERERKPPLWP